MPIIQNVPINSVVFDKSLYPRDNFDNELVNTYRTSIELLPPIKITENHILIDGYHRLLAHRLEKKEEIEAEIFLITSPQEILLAAIQLNATHGKQLTKEEKQRWARELYKAGIDEATILQVLSIKKSSFYTWTEKERKIEKEERDKEIIELYLTCYTQEEIAEKLGIDQKTVLMF